MAERITGDEFGEAAGVEDWIPFDSGAAGSHAEAYFATGSFAKGVALVDAIGQLADAANHHPDVDLRYPAVIVRVETHDVNGLSDLDISLARHISAAARELGIAADPSKVQATQQD